MFCPDTEPCNTVDISISAAIYRVGRQAIKNLNMFPKQSSRVVKRLTNSNGEPLASIAAAEMKS
jgi:hypothetical protein